MPTWLKILYLIIGIWIIVTIYYYFVIFLPQQDETLTKQTGGVTDSQLLNKEKTYPNFIHSPLKQLEKTEEREKSEEVRGVLPLLEGRNCQGNIYSTPISGHMVVRINGRYFKSSGPTVSIMFSSRLNPSAPGTPRTCENFNTPVNREGIQLMEEITLPFSDPLSFPLDFISE